MKWSMIVLIGIVLGGVALASVEWPSQPTKRPVSVPEPPQANATLPGIQIQDMYLMAQTGSVITWQVCAKQAAFSETAQRAVVQQVNATIFQTDAVNTWQITAERGLLDSASGDMSVEGHVRLQQHEGYTIETDEVHWHTANRLLSTDAPVTMRNTSVSISGTGFRSLVDQHRMTLQHDVRASFRLQSKH
jgi:LPS export ABC transporter protein LptC